MRFIIYPVLSSQADLEAKAVARGAKGPTPMMNAIHFSSADDGII